MVVVDDDAKMRESLESLLQSAEFSVAVFASAEETLQSLILAEANCLVSDIRMPGMHGLDLQRRVKRDFPSLPVILITGNYDEQVEARALADGAVKLLYKPFDPSDLVSTIRSAIEKRTENG
ncbi:MAG TPA: response regulator [Granulicella sp.]|nr:response regulator [Granulicella sp.]